MIANKIMPMTENLRVPPHSAAAEQSFLGAVMRYGIEDQRIRESMDIVSPDMLYLASHQDVYRTICETKITDAVALADEMQKRERLQNLQWADVVAMSQSVFTIQGVESYAKNIKQYHSQRSLIAICNNVIEQSYSGEAPEEAITQLNDQLSQIDTHTVYQPKYVYELVEGWVDELERRAKGDPDAIGQKTGIPSLDDSITGIGKSWLFILGGRPSHGKSLIAQHIANHVCRDGEVLFMSLEMTYKEIINRVMSLLSHIDGSSIRKGTLTEHDYAAAADIMARMKQGEFKLYYDETPGLSVEQVCARAKAFKRRNPNCKLIQIDYLGLMKTPQADRNDLGVGKITKRLKQLAKEIETPIMLLAQLNREADKTDRPQMRNLADSASIERDADYVMFTHSLEVAHAEVEKYKGHWQLICGKNRHGSMTKDIVLKRSENNAIIELDKQAKELLLGELDNKSNGGGFTIS